MRELGRSDSGAHAGGFVPSGFSAATSFAAKLREWIAAEAGAGRLLPWVPVAFGVGIAVYFTADHEPVGWVTALPPRPRAVHGGVLAVAAAQDISCRRDDRRDGLRVRGGDLEDGPDCP